MTRVAVLQPVRDQRHRLNHQLLMQLSSFVQLEVHEVAGCSEVARARCEAASRLLRRYYADETPAPDVVLWLDADVAMLAPEVLVEHIRLTQRTGLPISGRVPMRHTGVVAGSGLAELPIREVGDGWSLFPVRCGMAALALPWLAFFEHAERSPQGTREDGLPTWFVTCPRLEIVKHGDDGDVWDMISEDIDYTRAIGPVYYATGPESLGRARFLDYGHVDETVRVCDALPHEPPDWRRESV